MAAKVVLSGLPATPAVLGGGLGWGWEDWAILAATLIALAFFLFLLFLLLCLLCPAGLCCGKDSACCAGKKEEKKKLGLSSAQAVEMSSFGGSEESNLTAVDLKLPRAWMDASKGDLADDRGDLGLGVRAFGNQKTWSSAKADASSGALVNRSANFGNAHGRSENNSTYARTGADEDYHDGTAEDSTRLDYYRNQSAATIMTPNGGGKIREAAKEWERKSTMETRRLVESRQTRNAELMEGTRNMGFERSKGEQEMDVAYSTLQESSQREAGGSSSEAMGRSASMVLEKSSASASASGSGSVVMTSGTPIVQCYTVTKKTTTTTYGDEEGDEETAVVTTTEKKWREGMNEVGEISIAAAATAGELLPSIGAPPHVLSDVSNVRTVKSLTSVEGGASNIVRRYEFLQTGKDTDTLL